MSSTNKTEHYNLPQFIGSDIPTWLGDFNSAMTDIDTGINAAATLASGAATTAAQALNRCPFPIGYGGFFQTDPNSIYAGTTWEQKKDVFILAAGDTYSSGSTGGEAQHILTSNEMPIHDHMEQTNNSYADPHGLSTLVDSSKSGNDPGFMFDFSKFGEWVNAVSSKTDVTKPKGIEWTTKGTAIKTSTSGGSQPHNNMPPYFSMPFWVRKD